MKKGHYGEYSGNAKHSRVTSGNMADTKRDDEAHMEYLKEDVKYDDKHGHSDIDMTADEKHISKLAGDLKYDEKHHGAGKGKGAADGTGHKHPHTQLASELKGDEAINDPMNKDIGYLKSLRSEAPTNPSDIKQAPSAVTQFFRGIQNDTSGPKNFLKNIATAASIVAPIPSLGKLKAVQNLTKAFSNTTKQYSKLAKTKQVPIIGKPGKTTTVPTSSTTKQVSYANPRISGRTGSKPVDFKGPNPANKTGAGGNSYPSKTPNFRTIQSAQLEYMKLNSKLFK